eukprot:4784335-Pleurochrysis_carterae.AAC.2
MSSDAHAYVPKACPCLGDVGMEICRSALPHAPLRVCFRLFGSSAHEPHALACAGAHARAIDRAGCVS